MKKGGSLAKGIRATVLHVKPSHCGWTSSNSTSMGCFRWGGERGRILYRERGERIEAERKQEFLSNLV